jgi:trehalose 2-sulfotransferase
MQPHTSYLVCSTPRSGSTLLCEALKNTGLAGQPEEYFMPDNEAFFKELWGVSNYADYVERVIKEGTSPNGVFGAKIMWGYVDSFVGKLRSIPEYERLPVPELLSTVFPNLRYIWITRSDKVQQAVSLEKANQTNVWAIIDETSPDKTPLSSSQLKESQISKLKISGHHPLAWLYRSPSTGELYFDFAHTDVLLDMIESYEAIWQSYCTQNAITPLTAVYEELVATYEQTAIQILHELNVPVPEALEFPPMRMKKQADMLSEEWVQRYCAFNKAITSY